MFQVGDIVTVVSENLFMHGNQGKIISINPDDPEECPIEVEMHSNHHAEMKRWFMKDTGGILFFKPVELRKDKDWSIENKVIELFGKNMWHTIYTLKLPFDSTKTCCIDGCKNINQQRVLVNAWGVVCEYDMCLEHAKQWNGKCVDDVPVKAELG